MNATMPQSPLQLSTNLFVVDAGPVHGQGVAALRAAEEELLDRVSYQTLRLFLYLASL